MELTLFSRGPKEVMGQMACLKDYMRRCPNGDMGQKDRRGDIR